jgi:hypothetical protein
VRANAIDRHVYAPFPVAGLAAWTDTWGAQRYAGGYHPHHGQDLICAEGTPVLAVEPGTVRFSSDPLGGITLLLVRPDGSFWYYAHLERYANGIVDGEHVRTGQPIGLCGATGDATISHLHFSLYAATGQAIDPMPYLVSWLHRAERTAGLQPSRGTGVRVPKAESEAGAEPTDASGGSHPTQLELGAAARSAPMTPAQPADAPASGGTAVGLVVGATLLLLPLPFLSRRVRAGVRALRRASRSP